MLYLDVKIMQMIKNKNYYLVRNSKENWLSRAHYVPAKFSLLWRTAYYIDLN